MQERCQAGGTPCKALFYNKLRYNKRNSQGKICPALGTTSAGVGRCWNADRTSIRCCAQPAAPHQAGVPGLPRHHYPRLMDLPGNSAEPLDPRRSSAIAWLESLGPLGSERLERSKDLTLDLLRRSPDPFDRTDYHPGHITSSAVVLSSDRNRMLLLFHNRLRVWLQPGGHVEPSDPDVYAAARREVQEETGASLFPSDRPQLVGVDVHEIPAARGEPMHLHHDLVFRLVAQSDEIRVSPESRAVIWCPVEKLAQYQAEDALRDSVGRAIRME